MQPLFETKTDPIAAYQERKIWKRRLGDQLQLAVVVLLVMAVVWQYASSAGNASRLSGDLAKATGEIRQLRGEVAELKERPVGTLGENKVLADEYGLVPLSAIRESSQSFLKLNSYDNRGSSSYGTAGYLGDGYFITVKHGVKALDQKDRVINKVEVAYNGKMLRARVIDMGLAELEVDPGDWAIIRVKEKVDLPPLRLDLGFRFEFAEPIFRLGNDYSHGIIASNGYIGQVTVNKLVTSLTDGHPGASGGGVLNKDGALVAIPVGRMQGDYRFSFILPLRAEMFRKVPHLRVPPASN